MRDQPDIAFVGVPLIERTFRMAVLPAAAGAHLARSGSEAAGGAAARAAIAAARLGARARLVGWIGDDVAGAALRRALEGAGVDCRGLVEAQGRGTPVSIVFLDAAGARMQVDCREAPFEAAGAPAGALDGVDAVVCDLGWPDGAAAALEAAAERGVPGVLDFARAPGRGAHRLIDRASHVIFGDEALRDLSGGAAPEERLDRVAHHSPGRCFAALAGEAGVVWRDGSGRTGRIAAEAEVEAVGPGFLAAVAVALAEGRGFDAALRFAAAASRAAGPETPHRLAAADAMRERA